MIWLQVCTDAPIVCVWECVHFGISIMQMVRGVKPNTQTYTGENDVAAILSLYYLLCLLSALVLGFISVQ